MLEKLTFLLILLCLCAGANAAPPIEIAGSKVYKLWQFSRSAEGWRPDHNVGPFSIKDGILTFTNTGTDPWIINAEIGGADTSKYGFFGIRMRSSVPGTNQVFFATDESPLAESTSLSFPVRGDGQWHFYEVNLSKLKTWRGKLDVIRIDTVNGGSEVGARIDIDWIALYQPPARLEFGRPEMECTWDGRGRRVTIPIRNTGGMATPESTVITVNETKQELIPILPGDTRTASSEVKLDPKGYVARISSESKLVSEFRLMPDGPQEPRQYYVADSMCIRLYEQVAADGKKRVYGANASIDGGDIVVPGEITSFGTLVYRGNNGALYYLELFPETVSVEGGVQDIVRLSGRHKLQSGTASVQWLISESRVQNPDNPDQVLGAQHNVTCTLSSDTPVQVLRFEGPRLWIDYRTQHALFPGLQYLEANEPYTATQFIGPKLADQHIPHPYKIAVPLMAIETKDGVVGVSWDPLREWAPGERLPSAQFEPDKGLMTLFAPSIPDYVDENHDYATTPYTLKPGEKMTLKMTFFSEAGKKITDVIPDYLKSHPLKRTAGAAEAEKIVETCFKAYAGTLYSPKDKGWKNHFGLHQTYSPNPGFAAKIIAESLRTGNPELARKVDLDPSAQLAQYTGTTLDWFSAGAKARVDTAIARQSPDGGFGYQIDDEMRKKVKELAAELGGVDTDTLGAIGETNSGLIARELGAILDCAVRTGGRKYIIPALKGLDKLNSFTVPRGAQTWEVHAHAPDVFAAGLAIDCNIAGYHLTGDEKYLDHATFWAKTGLPFIYTWVPPLDPVPAAVLHFDDNGEGPNPVMSKPSLFYSETKRRITPGATIAVMGSSFYFVNWFGAPVQWCGLEWAGSVQALMKLRPDPILQSAADAVFVSGAQQQFDKGWAAGTYPDSWTLATNIASTAFIAPDTILTYAYGILGEKNPASVSTARFNTPKGNACLNSYAVIESFHYDPSSRTLTSRLKHFAGQDVYSCITNSDSPATVSVDGIEMTRVDDLRSARSGWSYDAENRALHVKYRAKDRLARLEINWQ